MKKNEKQKLEASIIAKLRSKKKQSNVDEFLLLVDAAKTKASDEILKVYKTLMEDLVQIELLKQEQQSLSAGLEAKYGVLLVKTDGFLSDLKELQQEADENVELAKMMALENGSQAAR